MQKLKEFERGILYAAYLICELHDEPTIAANVIREASLNEDDIRKMDSTEQKVLMKLVKNERYAMGIKS